MTRLLHVRAVFLVLATVAAPALSQKAPKEIERCTGCHGTPDPKVPGDELWIERIKTTACVQPAAPKGQKERMALIEWIRGSAFPKPPCVAEASAPKDGEGTVVTAFGRGSVLLWPATEGGSAAPVRLVWTGEKGERRERAVPAGDYVVRNYRVHRTDAQGVAWQIWGSGASGRSVKVVAGETASVALDLAVKVAPQAKPKGKDLQVGLAVTGDSGMGLTVVRAKDRVPATYEILGGGKRLASGDLGYG